MNYLLEGEITLFKRIWAFVVLIQRWIIWFFVVFFQFVFFAILSAIFDSSSGSENIHIPPILTQSKRLIQYSMGDSDPLAQHVRQIEIDEEQRKKYEAAGHDTHENYGTVKNETLQAITQAEMASTGFRIRIVIYTIITIIIVVGAFKFFGYI